jgi:hypothetical protein
MKQNKIYKCDICGREYSSHSSLWLHKKLYKDGACINTSHFRCVKCPICCKEINKGHFSKHLILVHGIDRESCDFYVLKNTYANCCYSDIEDKEIVKDLLLRFYEKYGNKMGTIRNFIPYYKAICKMREYNTESDNCNFVDNVFEWKRKHRFINNSKKLCELIFPNEPYNAERYYNEFMLSKNPFVGHDGKFSPFSKDFIGYKNLDDYEKEKRIENCLQHDKIGRSTNQIEYWIKRGLTHLEAKKMVHQRQQTFSKERCVKKYGYEEGIRIWKERQERWQNTLNSKPYEEQLRILKAKAEKSKVTKPYSKIEHEFSSQLVSDEYKNVVVTPYAIPDICVGWKIIDFFGDYYHCNPKKYKADFYNHRAKKTAQEIWNKDAERTVKLEHDGFIVKIVWESDYKADKEKVINECREFLKAE